MAYVAREVQYSFRQPSAKVIEEAKKQGAPVPIKRDPVTLKVPQITMDTLVSIANSPDDNPVKRFVFDVVNATLVDYVQNKLNEQPRHLQIDPSKIDMSDVSLETLATMPQDERKARGIPEEVWAEFEKDYREIMPAAMGLDAGKLDNHIKAFRSRFNPIKSNKAIIKKLLAALETWASNSNRLEELQQIYVTLTEKAENLLNAEVNIDEVY